MIVNMISSQNLGKKLHLFGLVFPSLVSPSLVAPMNPFEGLCLG